MCFNQLFNNVNFSKNEDVSDKLEDLTKSRPMVRICSENRIERFWGLLFTEEDCIKLASGNATILFISITDTFCGCKKGTVYEAYVTSDGCTTLKG